MSHIQIGVVLEDATWRLDDIVLQYVLIFMVQKLVGYVNTFFSKSY